MKRPAIVCVLALPLLAVAVSAQAEIKTREKTQTKFEGGFGKIMNVFGGKALQEGVVSTTAIKRDRKATASDTTGQIIDLAEERVYDLDFKKKTYEVVTFEELRRRMREAQEKARKEAEKEQGKEKAGQPQVELEVDFDVKETGQKRQIAGYEARQVIMTLSLREKGQTLEGGGGVVLANDMWLGPEIPEYREMAEFDQRYWKSLEAAGGGQMSAEQWAAIMAMYPMLAKGMERLEKESAKLQGTPLTVTMTMETVKSKAQIASETESQKEAASGGGLGGMIARKMMKPGEVKPRTTIFTTITQVQEISTTVPAADLEIPAGFKQKK